LKNKHDEVHFDTFENKNSGACFFDLIIVDNQYKNIFRCEWG
jgi:hypothetical protein